MTQIRTQQLRHIPSPRLGPMLILQTFIDEPATLETFVDNVEKIVEELGISAEQAYKALFVQIPNLFWGAPSHDERSRTQSEP